MYSDTVTNYFIEKVFSNVIQVPEYESNVTDYFWITSGTYIIKKKETTYRLVSFKPSFELSFER